MIIAGFALLAIGAVDALRQFLGGRARGIGIALFAVLMLVIGILGGAVLPALIGIVLAAVWVWLLPTGGRPRLSFWPAVILTAFALAAVAALPARTEAGVFSAAWRPSALVGTVSFDLTIFALGVFAIMLETGNVIVRAALLGEQAPGCPAAHTSEGAATAGAADAAPVATAPPGATADASSPAETDAVPAEASQAAVEAAAAASRAEPVTPFRGGRLIGPLERVLVLVLTLAGAYPLLAAMLAAKGIVRFPEISRDGAGGTRAEYFLVGSLVSWVVALGGAFLLRWAA